MTTKNNTDYLKAEELFIEQFSDYPAMTVLGKLGLIQTPKDHDPSPDISSRFYCGRE